MRVIAKSTLKNFWEIHSDSKQSLLAWYKFTSKASWGSFNEVKSMFGTCKIIGDDRIIFKIKGNQYRLVIRVTFINQIVWIRFVGTHSEYDKIDAQKI